MWIRSPCAMSETLLSGALAVPAVGREHFPTTFIRTAVCELRFPVLFELEGPKPPLSFAQAVRKEYPIAERAQGIELTDPKLEQKTHHSFRSKGGHWSIVLKSSSASLETHRYGGFEDFEERIRELIKALSTFIDSDFFTRIGIRYTNFLPYDRATVAEWINPALVAPLASGELGEAQAYSGQIRGAIDLGTTPGGYLLQHGIQRDEGKPATYAVDMDFYAEVVDVSDSLAVINKLHTRQYDLFRWAVGPKAIEALRKGRGH